MRVALRKLQGTCELPFLSSVMLSYCCLQSTAVNHFVDLPGHQHIVSSHSHSFNYMRMLQFKHKKEEMHAKKTTNMKPQPSPRPEKGCPANRDADGQPGWNRLLQSKDKESLRSTCHAGYTQRAIMTCQGCDQLADGAIMLIVSLLHRAWGSLLDPGCLHESTAADCMQWSGSTMGCGADRQ